MSLCGLEPGLRAPGGDPGVSPSLPWPHCGFQALAQEDKEQSQRACMGTGTRLPPGGVERRSLPVPGGGISTLGSQAASDQHAPPCSTRRTVKPSGSGPGAVAGQRQPCALQGVSWASRVASCIPPLPGQEVPHPQSPTPHAGSQAKHWLLPPLPCTPRTSAPRAAGRHPPWGHGPAILVTQPEADPAWRHSGVKAQTLIKFSTPVAESGCCAVSLWLPGSGGSWGWASAVPVS